MNGKKNLSIFLVVLLLVIGCYYFLDTRIALFVKEYSRSDIIAGAYLGLFVHFITLQAIPLLRNDRQHERRAEKE